jgi:hypothetical protein
MKHIIFGIAFCLTIIVLVVVFQNQNKPMMVPKVNIIEKPHVSNVTAQIIALYGLIELTASVKEATDWKTDFLLKQLADQPGCILENKVVRWRCLRAEPKAVVLHDDSKVAICSILVVGESFGEFHQSSAVFGASESYSKVIILVKRNGLQITFKQYVDLQKVIEKVQGVKFERFDKMLIISHSEEDETKSVLKTSELLLAVFHWMDHD